MSKFKIQENTKKEDIHIYLIDLTVTYSVYGQLVELKQGTTETSTFDFAILDKDINKEEQSVRIDFSNAKELLDIVNDFNSKLNRLKK